MIDRENEDEFGPSAHKDHALDYIATMLSELSEMAAASGKTDLADLIRDGQRLAKANDDQSGVRSAD